MNPEDKKYQISLFFLITGILLGGFFLGNLFFLIYRDGTTAGNVGSVIEEKQTPFENIKIEAKSGIVWDIKKQEVLYAFGEEAQLPLASLSKIMTALVAADSLSKDEVVTILRDSIAQEGDSGLLLDERWLLSSLINLTLMSSSNDGAHALAQAVMTEVKRPKGINLSDGCGRRGSEDKLIPLGLCNSFTEIMNQTAQMIGMRQTFFLNESGLDIHNGLSGAYGSSKDIALLLEYILKNHTRLFEATQYREREEVSLSGITHSVINTNENVDSIPGIIASKTGFTDLAGGNLAIVFEAGPMYPIAVVVLSSTSDGRFSDIEQLVWASLEYLHLDR